MDVFSSPLHHGAALDARSVLICSLSRYGDCGCRQGLLGLDEAEKEEPWEGGRAPCVFALAMLSPSASFFPVAALSACPA